MSKNNLKTSKAGKDLIRQFEGEILEVYRDLTGRHTVGVGHLVATHDKLKLGHKITKERSDELFEADIAGFEDALNKSLRVEVTQNEFDALVSLAFNIGANALRSSKSFRYLLNEGKKARFADAILSFNKARVRGRLQVVKGLSLRREAERKLFLGE